MFTGKNSVEGFELIIIRALLPLVQIVLLGAYFLGYDSRGLEIVLGINSFVIAGLYLPSDKLFNLFIAVIFIIGGFLWLL